MGGLRRRRRRALALVACAGALAAPDCFPSPRGPASLRLVEAWSPAARLRPPDAPGPAGGPGWHGLGGVWREALSARPGESFAFDVSLPPRPRLELALGSLEPGALVFRAAVQEAGREPVTLLQRTLTTPGRWEPASADLGAFGGRDVRLVLSLEGSEAGGAGLFGSPAVRALEPELEDRPRTVVWVVVDALRADHLDAYGYRRATAPNLARAAEEGVVFADALAPAPALAPSAASLLTGLYPASHGVLARGDALPDAARTAAERLRDAGYATASFASAAALEAHRNLHQGFEVLHTREALPADAGTKTARAQMDQVLAWLDDHAGVPLFALVHLSDPHPPYEPRPPYATLWADPDPDVRAAHRAGAERAAARIADPVRRALLLPGEEALRAAGADPTDFAEHETDWYDGAVRGLDAELARLFERLQGRGLAQGSLVVVAGAYGQELLEHGHFYHGHALHRELLEVPLVLWAPGRLPAGRRVDTPVGLVDVLPTVLDLLGLPADGPLQGRSLVPWLETRVNAPLPRPAFAEKPRATRPGALHGDVVSEAVHTGRWKLVRHTARPPEMPAHELYDRAEDPFERRNLAGRAPDMVQRLEAELDAWRRDTAAVQPGSAPAP